MTLYEMLNICYEMRKRDETRIARELELPYPIPENGRCMIVAVLCMVI